MSDWLVTDHTTARFQRFDRHRYFIWPRLWHCLFFLTHFLIFSVCDVRSSVWILEKSCHFHNALLLYLCHLLFFFFPDGDVRRALGFSSIAAALGDPLLVKFPPWLPALRHLRSCAASSRVKTQTRPVWRILNVPSQLSVYQRFSVLFFTKQKLAKERVFVLFPFGLTPLCAIWLKLCMCISWVWSVNVVWKKQKTKNTSWKRIWHFLIEFSHRLKMSQWSSFFFFVFAMH